MSHTPRTRTARTAAPAAALGLALPLLAGCGGVGGVTPSVTPPTPNASTTVVTGQVLSSTGGTVSGDRVVLNLGRPRLITALTDAQGRFTLSVPVKAITGGDALSVLDPSGSLLAVVPVTLPPTALVALPPIAVGPPPPPGSV